MSSKIGIKSEAQCPFFSGINSCSIICEPLVRRAESTIVHFQSMSARNSYFEFNCRMMDGGGCDLHRALMKKYE